MANRRTARLPLLAVALCGGLVLACSNALAADASALVAVARPHVDREFANEIPSGFLRPVSNWRNNEEALYRKLLQARAFSTVVVPIQVQDYAFDRPTRSLMTAELSLAVARGYRVAMPDPYLMQRALGDGVRRLDEEAVRAFALGLGASEILWSYVGHDRKGHMAVTVRDERWSGNPYPRKTKTSTTRSYENIPFSEENPPIEAYRALLPRILKDLGISPAASEPPKVASRFRETGLPATPFGLVARGSAEPARDAYYYQLLGALTPRREERTRERMFEKSLLALEHMTPASPQYRALEVRAYMELGLRPAALKVLGAPATPEEQELQAALNGNLPDVNALIGMQSQLVVRLLAMLDANRIAADYGVATAKKAEERVAALGLPGKIWPAFVARAFGDWNGWTQEDNLALKSVLDQDLPVPGYTAEGIVRGAEVLGDPAEARTTADLSVLEHVHRILAANPAKWCCALPFDRPSANDYLDFMEATATDNLMRRANLYTNMQGAPRRAIQFLARIASVYDGFPEFALQRGWAEANVVESADRSAREAGQRAAHRDALDALYWSNGQTRVAADTIPLLGRMEREQTQLLIDPGRIRGTLYTRDLPFRPFFSNWEAPGDPRVAADNSLLALRNSTSDFAPVRDLASLLDGKVAKPNELNGVLESIRGRFAGCPERDKLLADLSLKAGDVATTKALYRESIKNAPADWRAYDGLGTLLFKEGKTRDAYKIFMSYPGFGKDTKQDLVELSNDAYEAGSLFYWRGEFGPAERLYRIASDLDTGSNASLSSAIRLDMLEGDYAGAMRGSFVRARRYGDAHAYRDYFGMLHAMGHSDEAWSAFNVLVPRLHASQLWETALVGKRMARASDSDIAAWISKSGFSDVGTRRDQAAVFMVRAGVMDRMPSESLAQEVAEFAWPVRHHVTEGGYVVRASRSGEHEDTVGFKRVTRWSVPPGTPSNVPVKSDLVYFVEAYRALRRGDAARALAHMKEAAEYYTVAGPSFRYMLPYCAFAAAKAGDSAAVDPLLAKIPPRYRGFDYFLSKGVISGLAGHKDDALKLLRLAFYRRPYTGERPLNTEYQYAELVEWLYQATHQDAYRKLALDWAKKVEVFTPWYAWPYAMQAELETDRVKRGRAIAMAAYLDPGSERLSKIPKDEVAAAVRDYGDLNPFVSKSLMQEIRGRVLSRVQEIRRRALEFGLWRLLVLLVVAVGVLYIVWRDRSPSNRSA